MRAGFVLTYRQDLGAGRAFAYTAKLRNDTVDLAGPGLLEAWGAPECWHPGEGAIRWSRTEFAVIPLDHMGQWTTALLEVGNTLPVPLSARFQAGDHVEALTVQPGEKIMLTFSRTANTSRIEITCPVHRPSELDSRSLDTGTLGIAVYKLHYRA